MILAPSRSTSWRGCARHCSRNIPPAAPIARHVYRDFISGRSAAKSLFRAIKHPSRTHPCNICPVGASQDVVDSATEGCPPKKTRTNGEARRLRAEAVVTAADEAWDGAVREALRAIEARLAGAAPQDARVLREIRSELTLLLRRSAIETVH